MNATRRGSALPLAAAYVVLIVYASLHPFSDWRWSEDWSPQRLLLPWPHYWSGFDIVANGLGYMPLGFLLAMHLHGRRPQGVRAVLGAALGGAVLSWLMEATQHYLPVRVPSSLDWSLNTAGALVGGLLAMAMVQLGWVRTWQRMLSRWTVADDGLALTLLLAWPVALLFPAAAPLALGQVFWRLQEGLTDLVVGSGFEGWWVPIDPAEVPPLSAGTELLISALGALAPVLVMYTLVRRTHLRVLLAVGAGALGVGATALSTALSFGPQHAMTWVTRSTWPAFGLAGFLALVLANLPSRVVAALGLVMLTAGLFLVNLAPTDPYVSSSLQGWEQGRFIRFHGVAQWLAWAWPYAALAQLLRSVVASKPFA